MEIGLVLLTILLALGGWVLYRQYRRLQHTNRTLKNRLDLLQNAVGSFDAGYFHYKVDTNETYWDKNSLRIFGLDGNGRILAPGTWEALIHPDDLEKALEASVGTLNGNSTLFNHTYRILWPDNSIRWIRGTGFVIRDHDNNPLDVTGFHLDITQQMEYEQSLRTAENQAKQVAEAKTQFLANMSHEIRTPMNAIIGMIELLSLESPTPIQRRYLNTLEHSSDVLLRIIDDILDVSKIEAGKLKLEQTTFNLREVINQCLAVYTQASHHKNIFLSGRIDPRVPQMFTGDSTRLQQVLMNLISNAFKFTQSGHILIRVVPEGDKALKFSVMDTGVGIAENVIEHLFDRFSQADVSTTRNFGGTGLGLTIVKQIVELWGGRVSVHSQLGEGTTFDVVLPSQDPWEETEKAPGTYLLCTRHQALVDLWREDSYAPTMIWARDERQFTSALERGDITHLIVEQRFTDEKGSDLLRQSKIHHPNLQTILIGFEKYVKEDSSLSEIDRFQARPYIVNELWDIHFLHKTLRPEHEMNWPDYSHLRVLCVDDNQSNLIVLSGLLKRFGIQATRVENGMQAIDHARQQDFDLILMDYEMPDMDGPETTRQILASKPVTIIGLSAHTGEYFQAQAEESGMQGFLRKPIRLSALADLLHEHFSSAGSATQPSPRAGARDLQ